MIRRPCLMNLYSNLCNDYELCILFWSHCNVMKLFNCNRSRRWLESRGVTCQCMPRSGSSAFFEPASQFTLVSVYCRWCNPTPLPRPWFTHTLHNRAVDYSVVNANMLFNFCPKLSFNPYRRGLQVFQNGVALTAVVCNCSVYASHCDIFCI